LSARSATPDICRIIRFFRPLRRLRQLPSAGSTTTIRSIARIAECIARLTVRRLTVLQKPEIIAPSIWVPAPILPTRRPQSKPRCSNSGQSERRRFARLSKQIRNSTGTRRRARPSGYMIRQIIALKLREENVITRHYKYVDGTSFAAPIVSSVIAQMLEANPALTPQQIKRILISDRRTPAALRS
jgi:subtilisin family serine protease